MTAATSSTDRRPGCPRQETHTSCQSWSTRSSSAPATRWRCGGEQVPAERSVGPAGHEEQVLEPRDHELARLRRAAVEQVLGDPERARELHDAELFGAEVPRRAARSPRGSAGVQTRRRGVRNDVGPHSLETVSRLTPIDPMVLDRPSGRRRGGPKVPVMPVRIVTDSSCDLPGDVVDRARHRPSCPLTVRFGDEEFVDGVELSRRGVLRGAWRPPTTSPRPPRRRRAPSRRRSGRCADAGADAVVCINLSAQLSATMQSAQTAAKALEGTVDVRVRRLPLGHPRARLDGAVGGRGGPRGMGADAIVADVESQAQRQRIWATLDTLDNLKKGGRIGGAKALVAGLLSIKPAIDLAPGVVEEAGKPRTRGKALQWLADRLLEEPAVEQLCVVHGEAPDIDQFLALIAAEVRPRRLHGRAHRPGHRRPRRPPGARRHLPGPA